jgi:hypothetical protein
MRLRTKLGVKMLEARIWLLRKRLDWSRYPEIDPELLGEPDAETRAILDRAFASLRMN